MGLLSIVKKFKPSLPSDLFLAIVAATALSGILFSLRLHAAYAEVEQKMDDIRNTRISALPFSKIEKFIPTATPTPNSQIAKEIDDTRVWGIAEQISDTTWTMNVGEDLKMATPEEIQAALNDYRNEKGVGSLTWDEKLADFARSRAAIFIDLGKLDEHAGFKEYVEAEGNMEAMGFWGMGENSSIGFRLEGVHMIEWIFAGDPPHDNNQLDPSWTHVGIGVNGTAVDVIFGKK